MNSPAAPRPRRSHRIAPRITVVGSLNADLVISAPRLPAEGETILGGVLATFSGGKGANQAVAAARLGAEVVMVGRVGNDAFGGRVRTGLRAEGIDVSLIRADEEAPSGVALITVDPAGRNTIVVASGANGRVSAADVADARNAMTSSQIVLLQLEIPLDAVIAAAREARRSACRVILDPAPAQPLPDDLYHGVSVITPNETEAQALTGISVQDERGAAAAAARFLDLGCETAVIKLGARGALVATGAGLTLISPVPVEPVDTTAAGDAFAAALAVALAEGRNLPAAARFANVAGAFAVTRRGAQPSMPTRSEVEALARASGISL
ncbi:MAG: ribokinase [Armatimonadota bacterium]|nr:ribokinase [Armatimonadota bacterium]